VGAEWSTQHCASAIKCAIKRRQTDEGRLHLDDVCVHINIDSQEIRRETDPAGVLSDLRFVAEEESESSLLRD